MKKLFFMFLFTTGICFAQLIPHIATLTPSKDSVRSDEVFTVTYTLTNIKGYVYIASEDAYFETIGNNKWEGEIQEGEVKTLTFQMRLMKNAMERIYGGKARISVGFSYQPDNGENRWVEHKSIIMKIIDFGEFINKTKNEDSFNKINGTQNINIIFDENSPFLQRDIQLVPDATIHYLEGAEKRTMVKINKNINVNRINDQSALEEPLEMNSKNNTAATINVRYSASSMSFRDYSNNKLRWKYYTVKIYGAQSNNDDYPVELASQSIGDQGDGGFDISTSGNYPYFYLRVILESDIYIALCPSDLWDGYYDTSVSTYAWGTNTANTGTNINMGLTDPDFGSLGQDQNSEIMNICMDMVKKGNRYVVNNTNYIPEKSVVFYNPNSQKIQKSICSVI